MYGNPNHLKDREIKLRVDEASKWQGLVPEPERTDQSFCQFVDPVYGIRAIVKVMFSYRDKYGLKTVKSIINRYAPPIENNTQGYIQRVCTKLVVNPDEPIELTDEVLYWLIKAICGVENGNQYTNYYSRDIIERAIQAAK